MFKPPVPESKPVLVVGWRHPDPASRPALVVGWRQKPGSGNVRENTVSTELNASANDTESLTERTRAIAADTASDNDIPSALAIDTVFCSASVRTSDSDRLFPVTLERASAKDTVSDSAFVNAMDAESENAMLSEMLFPADLERRSEMVSDSALRTFVKIAERRSASATESDFDNPELPVLVSEKDIESEMFNVKTDPPPSSTS